MVCFTNQENDANITTKQIPRAVFVFKYVSYKLRTSKSIYTMHALFVIIGTEDVYILNHVRNTFPERS